MKKKRYVHSPALKFINTVLMCMPFIICWFLYYEKRTMTVNSRQSTVLMLLTYILLFYYFCTKLDGFRLSLHRIGELIFSQILAAAAADVCAAVLIWMLSIHFPNMWPGILCFVAQTIIAVPIVIFSHKHFFEHHEASKTIVVYDVRQGMENLIRTYGLEKRFAIRETCPIEEILERIEHINDYETVIMCGVHSHDRNIVLKACIENDIAVYLIPRVGDVIMSGAERMHMLHLPVLRAKRYAPSTEFRFLKRTFDIVASSVLLVVLSPLMLVVALLVRMDGGPAYYKQTRLTKDGKEFIASMSQNLKTRLGFALNSIKTNQIRMVLT